MKSARIPQVHRHSHHKRQHVQASSKGPATKLCGDGEWQRGQDCEIWKCLVTDLHGSRRLEYDGV